MLKFNGETPKKIFYNGMKVAKVVYRTFTVWVDKILTTLTNNGNGNIKSLELNDAVKEPVVEAKVYAHSYQGGATPTPEAPANISTTGEYDAATGKYKIPCYVGSNKVLANYDVIPESYTASAGTLTREGNVINLVSTTGTSNAIYIGVTIKDIFPELKVGDTVMFNINTTGACDHIWTSGTSILKKGGIITITQAMLDSDVNMYTNYSAPFEATITEISYYKTIKDYSVLLDEPLRRYYSVDYADYIDFANQKVVRKCGSWVLTGQEEGWYINGNYTTDTIICLTIPKANSYVTYHPSYTGGLSNKFVYGASEKVNTFRFSSTIYLFLTLDGTIYTKPEDINTTKMTDELREVIKDTEIIYIRKTPIEEAVDIPDMALEEGDNMLSIYYDNDSAPLTTNIVATYYKFNEGV